MAPTEGLSDAYASIKLIYANLIHQKRKSSIKRAEHKKLSTATNEAVLSNGKCFSVFK